MKKLMRREKFCKKVNSVEGDTRYTTNKARVQGRGILPSCYPGCRDPTKALIWVTNHFYNPECALGHLLDASAFPFVKIRRQVSNKGSHLHTFRVKRILVTFWPTNNGPRREYPR